MKGIIKGFEPIDYVSKKTNQPVKGATIYFDCKSKDVFGCEGKSEYIAESSPLYKRTIEPLLEKFFDESSDLYGGTIVIDYEVTKRGTATFTQIVDLTIIPKVADTLEPQEKPVKKAG